MDEYALERHDRGRTLREAVEARAEAAAQVGDTQDQPLRLDLVDQLALTREYVLRDPD